MVEQELLVASGINSTESGPEMEQSVRKQELSQFKAQTDSLHIKICTQGEHLFTPNEIATPEGKVPVPEQSLGRLRSSSQLLEEVILEQEEDNFKATNMWSNSEKSEEFEFEATN